MAIPEKLQKIVQRFASAPKELKGQALLRYAKQVPPLPADYADAPERMVRVQECQSPFFLATEVDEEGGVHLFYDCPPETPTVRGFSGVLMEGLEGEHFSTVLEVHRRSTRPWVSATWCRPFASGEWERSSRPSKTGSGRSPKAGIQAEDDPLSMGSQNPFRTSSFPAGNIKKR